jgi:hypothetical protein
MTIVSTAVALIFFMGGAYYFRHTERSFADLV